LSVDKPGAPENLQPSDVHAEYCKLSWSPPTDDGGAEVTGTNSRINYSVTTVLLFTHVL